MNIKKFIDCPHVPGSLTPSRTLLLGVVARMTLKSHGKFIEVGVHQGQTARMLAEVLTTNKYRKLHMYDSLKGLHGAVNEDKGCPTFVEGHLDLKGVPPVDLPGIVHAGLVEITIPKELPSLIAFAHIDLDLYCPTSHVLPHVWYNLSHNGVMVIDDYKHPAWPGVEKAVKEFASQYNAVIEEWVFDAFPEAFQAVIFKESI